MVLSDTSLGVLGVGGCLSDVTALSTMNISEAEGPSVAPLPQGSGEVRVSHGGAEGGDRGHSRPHTALITAISIVIISTSISKSLDKHLRRKNFSARSQTLMQMIKSIKTVYVEVTKS
ncbi:hypothetical protein J6590_039299 [Homalodisca vitripennis]|nr:hypothetical protein J6590_039299 [Homalodisca vitripennis]